MGHQNLFNYFQWPAAQNIVELIYVLKVTSLTKPSGDMQLFTVYTEVHTTAAVCFIGFANPQGADTFPVSFFPSNCGV